jgi:DNA-binding XRE family transcriptional regulator
MTSIEFSAWRHKLGLSQDAAAKLLGLSREAIEDFEREVTQQNTWQTQRIPKHIEHFCEILLLQRRLFDYLKMIERRGMVAAKASAEQTSQKRAQKLRNLLFDVDTQLLTLAPQASRNTGMPRNSH